MGAEAATTAALGWRSHAGWAVLVAIGTSATAPVVLVRERVQLLDGSLPRQPFHAAAESGLSLEEGALLISQVARTATLAAAAATEAVVAKLREAGLQVVGVGLAAGDRQLPNELSRILASHLLLHAAEGQLYTEALMDGSAAADLPVVTLAPKTILERAATAMSFTVADLAAALTATGKLAGPPWQKDHREAAAAALVALQAGRQRSP